MPMTDIDLETTKTGVRSLIAQYCDCNITQVTDDANLVHDLGVDSLDAMEIIMAIEELIGHELSREYDVANCVELTVSGLIAAATTQGEIS